MGAHNSAVNIIPRTEGFVKAKSKNRLAKRKDLQEGGYRQKNKRKKGQKRRKERKNSCNCKKIIFKFKYFVNKVAEKDKKIQKGRACV